MNKNDHSESKKCDKRFSAVAVVFLVCVITPSIINTFVDETSVPLLNTRLGPGRLHCTDMIMGLSRISQRWIILKISGAFNSSEVAKEAHGYVGRGQISDVLRIRWFKPPVNLDRVFTRNKSPWRPLLSVMRIDRVVNLSRIRLPAFPPEQLIITLKLPGSSPDCLLNSFSWNVPSVSNWILECHKVMSCSCANLITLIWIQ